MPAPNPPHHPTPTPTPRPVEPGYYSPADYLAACCAALEQTASESNETYTAKDFLNYVTQVRDVLYAAET